LLLSSSALGPRKLGMFSLPFILSWAGRSLWTSWYGHAHCREEGLMEGARHSSEHPNTMSTGHSEQGPRGPLHT
jgi:hypothetical protein